ncbi:MAG: nitroreductase/quinone reductase family protein [Armatimonadota bacterium]|nr:nitroreductase/quinone reductase family protein [Armatimonadota bacterium]
MAQASFASALERREEITIAVRGRRTGKTITLPVWFVHDRATLWLLPVRGSRSQWFKNVVATPTITVRAGRQRQTLPAYPVRDARTVRAVVRKFQAKYTPAEIARYYDVFDAAVRVPLGTAARSRRTRGSRRPA